MVWVTCFCWAIICGVAAAVRMAVCVDWAGMLLLALAAFDATVGVIVMIRERWYD